MRASAWVLALAAVGTCVGVVVGGIFSSGSGAGIVRADDPTFTPTVAPTSYYLAVDCDVAASGRQSDCTYPTTSSSVQVSVAIGNVTNSIRRVMSFNYDLYNPDSGLLTPSAPMLDTAGLPGAGWTCNSPPPLADTGLGAAGTTTSFMGCFDNNGVGQVISAHSQRSVALETFNVTTVGDADVVLTLSNVNTSDENFVPLFTCDPSQAPPAVPDPTGPCLTASLHFRTPPTATPTFTATNTPTATSTFTVTPTFTATVAPTSYDMAIDCDVVTAGVQNDCTFAPIPSTITLSVAMGNVTNASRNVAAFDFDLYNPNSGVISPAAAPALDPAGLPAVGWSCASPPPLADTGLGAPGTTTSKLGCYDAINGIGDAIGAQSQISIAHETFNVTTAGDADLVLTLSNVHAADENGVTLVGCDPTAPPPAVPDPAGPCLTATLHFRSTVPTATPTNTPTPTNTATPTATPAGSVSGTVYYDSIAIGNEVSGARVQVCRLGPVCIETTANGSGEYTVASLIDTGYLVTAFPPGDYLPSSVLVSVSGGSQLTGRDIVVVAPVVPPGTTINNQGAGTVPVVFWGSPTPLTQTACPGGTVSYTLSLPGQAPFQSGTLVEGPPGTYTGTMPPVYPHHGAAIVAITIDCGTGPTTSTANIYIDPSGVVRTTTGAALIGATVTLYRSDSAGGPFTIVPNDSAIMSVANRANPDITDGVGHFGWDVVAGYYKVRAEFPDCVSPSIPSQAYTESAVLTIPPPVTDLDLRLNCTGSGGAPTPCAGDSDCDGVIDASDDCASAPNTDQTNTDRNFVDLPPSRPFDDLTLAMSDTLGDACDLDSDNDGLTDAQETGGPPCVSASGQTDAHKADTDGDRALDGAECALGTDPLNAASKPPLAPAGDADHDGLTDAFELAIGTNPALPDTDGDKLNDGVEFVFYGTSPLNTNSDGDTCRDGKEAASLNADTTVNSTDQLLVAQSFGLAGGPKYVVDFDVNKDGNINSTDLLIQAKVYGSCP